MLLQLKSGPCSLFASFDFVVRTSSCTLMRPEHQNTLYKQQTLLTNIRQGRIHIKTSRRSSQLASQPASQYKERSDKKSSHLDIQRASSRQYFSPRKKANWSYRTRNTGARDHHPSFIHSFKSSIVARQRGSSFSRRSLSFLAGFLSQSMTLIS